MSPKGNKKSSGNPHGGPAKRQANKNKNKGSETAAPSAPGSTNASGADASIHAPKDKETSPLDASPDKDIMDTNDTGSSPIATPTITILRRDFQAAAAPNASPEFVKKYPTNRAMIDAVNNLLLETYHSYTGRA
ncbi:hypothetical protein RhiirA4_487938 [Rhizophagus irregularis]|uniref:Uncharacterized protein n=1 Tax=Rhizophagus irregularis TaxID=588596 RepID=A0A2I1HT55_9GLOM|nr:hypothetical protein RhiirA4_487938 [Rhizophagus irregularis]